MSSSKDTLDESQIVELRPEMLSCLFSAGSGSVDFYVNNPDSRLRVKTTLMYVPKESLAIPTDITTGVHQLYMGVSEIDDSGSRGCLIPVGDLVGTLAAPITIPANANLMGYSREFVTAGDVIWGRLTTTYMFNKEGRWMLQVRYQPDGQRLCPADWAWVKTQLNVRVGTPLVAGSIL